MCLAQWRWRKCRYWMRRVGWVNTIFSATHPLQPQAMKETACLVQPIPMRLKKKTGMLKQCSTTILWEATNSSETNDINNYQGACFSEGLPGFKWLDSTAKKIRAPGRVHSACPIWNWERYVDNLQVVLIYRMTDSLRGGDHSPL